MAYSKKSKYEIAFDHINWSFIAYMDFGSRWYTSIPHWVRCFVIIDYSFSRLVCKATMERLVSQHYQISYSCCKVTMERLEL